MNRSRRLLTAPTLASLVAAALPAQCGVVADISPGATGTNIGWSTAAFGNELYFVANEAATGLELWKWNASAGAQLVVDLAPGIDHSRPEHLTPCITAAGPRVFYSAFEIGHGHELYASDGTAAGTGRVVEIMAGTASSLPFHFCALNGRVYFNATDASAGAELWVSDGTAAGTARLSDFAPGAASSRPIELFAFDDRLLFSAWSPTAGRELCVSDGTAAGTFLLRDIRLGVGDSAPTHFARLGDHVYFLADDGVTGREVWRTDGTTAGTTLVANLFGTSSVGADELRACGDLLYFREWGSSGHLFASDGTAVGTVDLGVIGRSATSAAGRVFFAGYDGLLGSELWVTDGTAAGTQLVADLAPGPVGSSPAKFVDCGPGVCFVASTATTGELWYSDGTAAGTTLLCTLDPGGAANPDQLTMCRGRLFVDASSPTYGRELYGIATPGASRAVLGEASAPDRPRLATAGDAVPILGTTIALTGSGPPGYAGVLLVGGAGLPTAVPQLPGFLEGGADWTGVQAGNALTVATLPTASFTVPFAAPVDPAFEGLVLQLQTIWFHPTVAPTLQVSNGLQLVLGAATPH